jgi:hypothetical protein
VLAALAVPRQVQMLHQEVLLVAIRFLAALLLPAEVMEEVPAVKAGREVLAEETAETIMRHFHKELPDKEVTGAQTILDKGLAVVAQEGRDLRNNFQMVIPMVEQECIQPLPEVKLLMLAAALVGIM